MPLLRGSPFIRKKIPRNLPTESPLYYFNLTREVFTEYEEFCNRTMLCNSLVWTCTETGTTDLTYAEAIESEARARQSSSWYPEELKVPTLYLASITRTSSFHNLVSRVFQFIQNHYFLNEVVESRNSEWHFGRVVSVQPPEEHRMKSVKKSEVWQLSDWYMYTINTNLENEFIQTVNVYGTDITRPYEKFLSEALLSRFLGQFVVKNAKGIWVMKRQIPAKYNIQHTKFDDIFAGNPPVFTSRVKRNFKNRETQSESRTVTEPSNELKEVISDHNSEASCSYEGACQGIKNENSVKNNSNECKSGSNSHSAQQKNSAALSKTNEHMKNTSTVQQRIERYYPPSKQGHGGQKDIQKPHKTEIKKDNTDSSMEVVVISSSEENTGASEDKIKVVSSGAVRKKKKKSPESVPSPVSLAPDAKQLLKRMRTCAVFLEATTFPKQDAEVEEIEHQHSECFEEEIEHQHSECFEEEIEHQHSECFEEEIEHQHSKSIETTKISYPSKKNKEIFEEQSSNNGMTSKKKLKQTDTVKQFSATQKLEKKPKEHVMSLQKKSLKAESLHKKKQKVVATLKPWLQRTNKEEPSKKKSASHTKDSNSEFKQPDKLEIQREIELQKEIKKKDEEKVKAKEEENRQKFAKFYQEWSKRREDLLCEDSKPLPRPCDVLFAIPNESFGEFVMILEFLHYFKPLLQFKHSFPNGVTFELLERALVEKEMAGPLCDLFNLLLSSIFDLQSNESEKPNNTKPTIENLTIDLQHEEMTLQSNSDVIASGWNYVFHGIPLNDIPINPITVSEVLRLHLMTSGGQRSYMSARWSVQRGGYDLEDPGLWLRLEKPSILSHLSQKHVCELSIIEKLDILSCLVNQLLTYRNMREKLEECSENTRKAKAGMRALHNAKIKLQKKVAAIGTQQKKEAKLLLAKVSSNLPNNDPSISQEEWSCEKTRIEKEINGLKAKIENKHEKIFSMSHQLLPIGTDRAHRNYWMFSSLPGLYVEYNPFEVGSCLPQPTPLAGDQPDKLSHVRRLFEEESHNASSDKENDCSDGDILKPSSFPGKKMIGKQNSSFGKLNDARQKQKFDEALEREACEEGELLVCTSSDNCPVHCPLSLNSHWGFFAKQEDITCLLNNLNERGIRENALRRRLSREKQRVLNGIEQCPVHRLNPTQSNENEQRKSTRISSNYKADSPYMKYRPGTPVSHIMEDTLRENILNLENKISSSCVGSLKVNDRVAWRNAIQSGSYDKQCNELMWGFHEENSPCKQTELEITKTNEKKCLMKDTEQYDSECEIMEDNVYESSHEANTSTGSGKSVSIIDNKVQAVCNESRKVEEEPYAGKGEQNCGHLEMYNQMNYRFETASPHSTHDIEKLGSIVYEKYSEDPLKKDKCNDQTGIKNTDSDLPSDKHFSQFDLATPSDTAVKGLKSAILQVEQCISHNFLKKPLVTKRSTINRNLKAWEESLMKSINLSQLFIHLLTLENSINWTKAHTRCSVCASRKKGDAKKMVLCDNCNKNYHIYCLKPKLKRVPRDDWFCPDCEELEVQQATRNVKRVLENSESSSDTQSRDEMERRSARIKQRKEIHKVALIGKSTQLQETIGNNICSKCKLTGHVIHCSNCSAAYHPDCMRHPKRIPRLQKEGWQCEACKSLSQLSETYDETTDETDKSVTCGNSEWGDPPDNIQNNGSDMVHDVVIWTTCYVDLNKRIPEEIKSTNVRQRRGCSSATIAKIATYTKRLRCNSWNDDDDDDESDEKAAIATQKQPSLSTVISSAESSLRRSLRQTFVASDSLPLDNAILQSLITDLIRHEDSWPFVRPVRKSEVPCYHKIIKKPMDLGTVKYKLNTAEYKNNKDFINDVILIFKNCYMYNHPESIEYRSGEKLRAYFEDRCNELGLKCENETFYPPDVVE